MSDQQQQQVDSPIENRREVQLTRIVINKFLTFKLVDLHFDKFTSINGKGQMAKGLLDVKEGIKFVLDCCDLAPNKLNYNAANEDDDDSPTFVEAHIKLLNGVRQTFKKSLINNDVIYSVDGFISDQEGYKRALHESQIILPISNTLVIDARFIDKATTLTDKARSSFIESLCGSVEINSLYDDLATKINNMKIEYDSSVRQQKEMIAEKRKMKKDLDATQKRAQLLNDLEVQVKQFDLFRAYHNEKFLEAADGNSAAKQAELDEARAKKEEIAEELKAKAEQESSLSDQIDEMKQRQAEMQAEIQASQERLQLERTKMEQNEEVALHNAAINKVINRQAQYCDEKKEEIEALQKQFDMRDEAEKIRDKYLKLRAEFEKSVWMEKSKLKSLSKKAEIERAAIVNEELNQLKPKIEVATKKVRSDIESLRSLQEKRARNESLSPERTRRDDDLRQTRRNLLQAAEKRLTTVKFDALKAKYLDGVIGRLGALWKPADGTSENVETLINARLGKLSDAIVVDTKETAEKCIEFMVMLGPTAENFIVLSEIPHQKSTKSLLPNVELRDGVETIESLFTASSKEIANAMLFHMRPAIVVKSLDDAEEALKLDETKKICVVSLDTLTWFHVNGMLEQLKRKPEESGDELAGDDAQEPNKVPNRRGYYESEEIRLVHARQQHMAELKVYSDLWDKWEKELESLRTDLIREQMVAYVELSQAIDRKKQEHFKAFIEEIGDGKSIYEYEKAYMSPEVILISIEKSKSQVKKWEEECQSLKDSIKDEIDALSEEEVNRIEEDLKTKSAQLSTHIAQTFALKRDRRAIIEEMDRLINTREELAQQVFKYYDEIYDGFHGVEMSYIENYEMLKRSFMQFNPMPVKAGTAEDFMVLTDDVTEDFNLVVNQLTKVEIDYSRLRSSLKQNVNVAEKTRELSKKIDKLRKDFDSTSGKIKDEVNEQRIERVTECLSNLNTTVGAMNTLLEKADVEFKKAKLERKRLFEEAIKVINKELVEFGLSTNEGVMASLVASTGDEPYLDEVAFYWRTADFLENTITELSSNYLSSLALLFGILKVKKQRFVILDTKKFGKNVDEYLKETSGIQVISLTSKISDDNSNYIVRPMGSSFVIKPVNIQTE